MMWNLHCQGAFSDMKEAIRAVDLKTQELANQMAAMNSYVRNGLTHRLNAVTGLLAAVGAALIISIALKLIGL
jgi:hypothetical protein